jgi:WD40 repeat protein
MKKTIIFPFIILIILNCTLSTVSGQKPELVLPIGHTGKINSADFSPDGKYIVTASDDKSVKIWEVKTGKLFRTLEGHTENVRSAVFSEDGKSITSISIYHCVKIWDVQTGAVLYNLKDNYFDNSSTVFRRDSKLLLTNIGDSTQIWDVSSGKLLCFLQNSPSYLQGAAFNPDGNYIIADFGVSGERKTYIWESTSGKMLNCIKVYYDEEGGGFRSRFSPSCAEDPGGGKYLIVNSPDSAAEVWESKGKMLYSIRGHAGPLTNAHFSPDTKFIVTTSRDNTAKIWETRSGNLISTLKGHDYWVSDAQFSPDSKKITTTSYDGSAIIWKCETGKILFRLNPNDYPYYARFSPPNPDDPAGGKYLITYNDMGYNVHVWETATGKMLGMVDGFVYDKYDTPFSADGKCFITSYGDKKVNIWGCSSGNLLHRLEGHSSYINNGRFSPDGKFILTAQDSMAKVWECSTLKLVRSLTEPLDSVYNSIDEQYFNNDILSSQYSPVCHDDPAGGRFIMTASGDDTVRIWESISGKLVLSLKGGFKNAQFSPDGRKILIMMNSSEESTLEVRETHSGKLLSVLNGDLGEFNNVEFSPDGKYIVSVSRFTGFPEEQKVRIWDTRSGNLLFTYNTDDKFVCAHFSPACPDDPEGGKYLVTGSLFNTNIYESATGKKLLTFGLNKLESVLFSPDGKYLIVASHDSTAQIWETNTGNLTRRLKGHTDWVTYAKYSPDGRLIVTGSADGTAKTWDAATGRMLQNIDLNGSTIYDINWKDSILISHDNSLLSFYNINRGTKIVSLIVIDQQQYIAFTPDMYYMAGKGAAGRLSWRVGMQLYYFDQFDLQYNRPDIVLERLWNPDTSLIRMYRKAYEKRLRKTGFNEKMFSPEWHTPEMKILNSETLSNTTDKSAVQLRICGTDSKYNLDRLLVWVNDVPVYGTNGISVIEEKTDSIVKTIDIKLSTGDNNIKVSCINEKGVESLKESIGIVFNPQKTIKPDLYIIAMSVSDYKDNRYDLQYAAKDGKDIASLFSSLAAPEGGYGKVFIDTLFNKSAIRKNFFKLKQKLSVSKVDDEVVVFVSGHGLLNKDLNFYYATYDIDFRHPEENGISFDELESILDGIPARKKLLMMDACHSGEVDKDEVPGLIASNVEKADNITFRGDVKEYSYKGVDAGAANSGLSSSTTLELMQELFAGLDQGTGTTVISAAAGKGYALESPQWNNGIFTYSIINGLKNMAADRNKDGTVTISELKDYSIKQVQLLTGGRQKPTARRESINYDWRIW